MRQNMLKELLYAISFGVAFIANPAYSQNGPELPECAVRIDIAREGAGTAVRKPWRHEDTAIVLDRDTAVSLAVILRNEGKAEAFDVSISSAIGLNLTSGSGNHRVTVKPGEAASLPVSVRGSSVANTCRWESRSFRVSVKMQGGSKGCGQKEQRFLCPRKPVSASGD